MFKKNHVVLAGVLGISMIMSGCGNSGAASKVDAKEILKTAQTSFKEVKSYDLGIKMDMSMDMKEQGKLDMTMTAEGSMIQSPELKYQLDSKIDMKIGEENQTLETKQYVIKEDTDYMMYMNTMGVWGKTKLAGIEQVESMIKDPAANLDVLLEKIDDVTLAGEENIAGIDCYALKINLTKEYFDTVLGDMDMLSSMGIDQATLKQTLDAIDSVDALPICYYVNKESKQLVGMNMDMGSLVKSILLSTGEVTEEQIGEVKVVMDMTVSNIDGVSEITLPEEAKSAIEM